MYCVQGKLKDRGVWCLCLDSDDRPEIYIDKSTAIYAAHEHIAQFKNMDYRVVHVEVVVKGV